MAIAQETGAVLVGHAYRARPGRARLVSPHDPVELVGDEALMAARRGLRVVVAPRREDAVAYAARLADLLVLDGVHQLEPRPAELALLAVDPDEPWGRTGMLPPQGDLRAPRDVLLRACDRVVPVETSSRGAWWSGRLIHYSELRGLRVGLVTSLARPERLVRGLAQRGVIPVELLIRADHDPARSLPRRSVDLWLASPKCGLLLPAAALLDHEVRADVVSRVLSSRRP
jgi:tetraacyldisaccharide-1-P 4'-kinase